MTVRKNDHFPICQYVPSGLGVFLRRDFGWIVQLDFTAQIGKIQVVATEVNTRTAMIKAVRGRSCDVTKEEIRADIEKMLAHYQCAAKDVLPTELRRFLFGQEELEPVTTSY